MKKYKINRKFTYNGNVYYIHADSEAEYAQKYYKKMTDLENESKVSGGNMKLSVWAGQCIDTYKTGMKDITLEKYRYKVKKYVLDHIGELKLKEIKPLHCQQTLNARKGNSKATINDAYQILKFLFGKAVENELIKKNPAEFLQKPSGVSKSNRALTEFEREHLIKVCTQTRKYYLYLLMLFCGCRPSEAAECMGKDIQIIKGYYMLHIRGMKSLNSDRYVPIPEKLLDLIKDTPKDEYIACYSTGKKIAYSNRHHVWKSCRREINLSMGCETYRNKLIPPYPLADDLTPYCLRHTYCTDLARKGIDIRVAQKLMGHSDIRLTANIYTNLDNTDIIAAARILNSGEGATKGATTKGK